MIARLLTLEEALDRGLRAERWTLYRDPQGKVARMVRDPDLSMSSQGLPTDTIIHIQTDS